MKLSWADPRWLPRGGDLRTGTSARVPEEALLASVNIECEVVWAGKLRGGLGAIEDRGCRGRRWSR